MIRVISTLLLISVSFILFSQNRGYKSVINHLKNNRLEEDLIILNNDTLQNIFKYQYLLKATGLRNDSLLYTVKKIEYSNGVVDILANYTFGDHLISQSVPNDSLAFSHYRKALDIAKQRKDSLLVNECLVRICDRLFFNGKDLDKFKSYINEFDDWKVDKVDAFWVNYYEIAYKLLRHYENNKERNTIDTKVLTFDKGFELASQSEYFIGVMHQLKGIYYDVFTNNYYEAEKEFKLAINYYEKNTILFLTIWYIRT